MYTEIKDFLSKEDCEHIKNLIDNQHVRSTVADTGRQQSVESDYRTSSTSTLDKDDKVVAKLHKKIAAYLGIDIAKGEELQGQLYEPGQYFKAHHDYFDGDSYINHCLSSGNRTHTLMVFLNEDMEGGHTFFPSLKQSVKPETGKALVWDDMDEEGKLLPDSIHEGLPVTEGKKYIVTSWWRENAHNPAADTMLAQQHWDAQDLESKDIIKFSSKEELPKISPLGFKVMQCPTEVWGIIADAYNLLRINPQPETGVGRDIIDGGEVPSEMMSFDNLSSIRQIIHEKLLPIHKEFAGGREIEPTSLYGIRSYNKGATLINHTDTIGTHHVSSIIIVDKDLDCGCNKTKGVENDWALDFQDHNGEWHKIYAEIGDIILYESATNLHGRTDPFKGNWYRNFYVHYKYSDYVYESK
jgi:prolyl 4-hydroxylase|tara:strand:+ start:3487 stop:4722 length:1236 start_codon:yes stop_codon:yes gene_type:complete